MEGYKSRINCGILDLNQVALEYGTHTKTDFESKLKSKIKSVSNNRGADYGLVLASLPLQYYSSEEMLLDAGFRFVRDFYNPNMGHDGRLYALVLEDAKKPRSKEHKISAGVKKKYNV